VTRPATFANDLRDQLIALFQPSDNKLAMKLFGNKNALMKEKLRQKAVGKWVIHPCSNFRLELLADCFLKSSVFVLIFFWPISAKPVGGNIEAKQRLNAFFFF